MKRLCQFFLLIFPIIIGTISACSIDKTTFVIENFKKIEKNDSLILTKITDSLSQCSKLCSSLKTCQQFIFSFPNCQLYSKRSTQLLPSRLSTSGRKLCLEKKCLRRSFAFEKFENRAIINSIFILKTFSVSIDECLKKCQNESECRAVFYNSISSLCQLSKVSINSVYNPRLFFKPTKNVNLYENNCIDYKMTTSSCSYMRVNGGGLKDVSDQIIRNVRDADECEQMCLVRSRIADPCRSYTHDNSTSECHLMWASSRLLGRSPLENMKESLSHGDLDDCMNFSLKCKEKNIEVKASSMKMFVGRMMTKKEKTTICETKFDEGKFDFSSKFDFDTCGLRTSNDEAYRGMVFLKEGSTNLVTIRDKILQVNCRMHLSKDFQERSEQSLSIKMKVENRNKTDFVMSDDFYRKPSFSLKILSSNFSNVDSVRIGDYGWIVLDVQNSDDDFTISNLFAKDINSGRKIRIIDEDGCVIRRDFIQKIEKKPNQIKFKINFSGFQRETEVIYITKVETCTVDCLPKCNLDLLDSTKSNENILTGPLSLDLPRRKMVRRAVEGEPRKLELTNDVYEVRGHRLILLNPKKLENNFGKRLTSDVSRRKHLEDILEVDDGDVIIVKKSATLSSSFRHCFIDDVTCLFTIVLASVQLFLLFSCCLIMYFYYQQWRQIRQMNMSIDHHVEYYRFDGTTSLTPKESSNSEVQETTS